MPNPPLLRAALLLAAVAISPALYSTGAAAQNGALPSRCTRTVHTESDPAKPKKPRTPDEVRRDSIELRVLGELRELINRHAATSGVEAPQGVLVFRAPRGGVAAALVGYRANLPDSVLARIEQDAAVALGEWPGASRPYVNMRVDSAYVPKPAVGDTLTTCRPELLHRELVANALRDFLEANPRVNRARTQQAVVHFYLTREGTVLAPYIHRSSGNAQLDQFAVDLVPRLLFRVAEYNGVPVDVWNSIPITIQRPPPEPPRVPGMPAPRVP
jgi:TonB family protein